MSVPPPSPQMNLYSHAHQKVQNFHSKSGRKKHSLNTLFTLCGRVSSEALVRNVPLLSRNDPSIQPAEFSVMNCPHVDNRNNGTVCNIMYVIYSRFKTMYRSIQP